MTLFVGLFLLFAPFLLLIFFEDKKKGFIFILFWVIIFQSSLAFFTQLLGVFRYNIILTISVLGAIGILCLYLNKIMEGQVFHISKVLKVSKARHLPNFLFNKSPAFVRKAFIPKIDWVLVLIIIIFILNLWQVHYNYTGKINLATDTSLVYHDVKNFKYPYPYYSDEWYAVALIKNSIETKGLPIENPFVKGEKFFNFELFFHSFLSEIFLLLKLNPLTDYTKITIFLNTLIGVLVYLFLRIEKIRKLPSAITVLSLLYITSGANLPGIWHLIPITMGIISSLIGFCFMALAEGQVRDRSGAAPDLSLKMAVLTSILIFLFYPPLLIFYLIGLLFFGYTQKIKNNYPPKKSDRTFWEDRVKIFLTLLFIIIPVFYISFLIFSWQDNTIELVFSKLFYPSFSFGLTPQYPIYKIIPLFVILISIFGIYLIFKTKKWLVFQIILGGFFWLLYSFLEYRVIIDYQRVVFFTSLLLVIASGFGLQKLADYFKEKIREKTTLYFELGIIILFLVFTPFYTQRETWKDLILLDWSGNKAFPKAPANMYLTEDDLRIFKDIKEKKFLSSPWKGTVIATATDNYPASTKSGTITVNPELYSLFLDSTCQDKRNLAKDLDYVYSLEFDCQGFEKIEESREGFVLYKVNAEQ